MHGVFHMQHSYKCRLRLWERVSSLIHAAIHLLSRIQAARVTIEAKQTLACKSGGVIQMHGYKDGGFCCLFFQLCREVADCCGPPPCILLCTVSFKRHHFNHWHHCQRRSRFSLPGNAPLSLSSPSFCPRSVSLAGSLKAEGLCADVPGERPTPLPWENMWSGSVYAGTLSSCLPHSMLASVSTGWQCSALLPQKGAFSGWGDTSNHVDSLELTNRRDSNAN